MLSLWDVHVLPLGREGQKEDGRGVVNQEGPERRGGHGEGKGQEACGCCKAFGLHSIDDGTPSEFYASD